MMPNDIDIESNIKIAAEWITESENLLITAGAGMGVDSGLPDFRGTNGFWRAYPQLKALDIDFANIANMGAFEKNPLLAWGFYAHRLAMYQAVEPHPGFAILKKIAHTKQGYFVFTSNVDGQFQKAGYPDDRIVECHGSIHAMQCMARCTRELFKASEFAFKVEQTSLELTTGLPYCPYCAALLRPNILMFGDYGWNADVYCMRDTLMWKFIHSARNLLCIEIGAGSALPSVRCISESCPRLIRINPTDVETAFCEGESVAIALGGLEALTRIEEMIA